MAVTLADIAKYTGMSMSTVSAALKNNPSTAKTSAATQKKILDAAKELGYRPSYAAKSLKTGKTNVFCLIVGEIHNPSYGELASLLIEEAEKHNYRIQVTVTQWDLKKAEKALNAFLDGRCDGIIIYLDFTSYEHLYSRLINNSDIPIVIINSLSKTFPVVYKDFTQGFVEAIEYLKEKKRSSSVFLGCNLENKSRLKIQHLLSASRKCHYPIRLIECDYTPEAAYKFAKKIKNEKLDSIIVENETMAMALLKGMKEENIKVPDDISVIGIDDTVYSVLSSPALTTIGYDKKLFCEKTISALLEEVNNRGRKKTELNVPTYLIKRESA